MSKFYLNITLWNETFFELYTEERYELLCLQI